MQHPAQIFFLHQCGNLVPQRRCDFAHVFPQLGRHIAHAERRENRGFIFAANQLLALEQAPFTYLDAELESVTPHRDVVLRRAGQVMEKIRKFLVACQPQIRLHAACQQHRAFGIALGNDALHAGQRREKRHDRRPVGLFAARDNVDVLHCFPVAAQASGQLGADDFRVLLHCFEQRPRRLLSMMVEMPARIPPDLLDPVQQVLLALGAEAFQIGDAILPAGFLQIVDRGHAQFVQQSFDLFGAEAGNAHQLHDSRGKRAAQVFIVFECACGHQCGDLLGNRLADAFDFAQAVACDQLVQIFGNAAQCARRIAVGARLKRVFTLELEQGTDFFENLDDLFLVHGDLFSPC